MVYTFRCKEKIQSLSKDIQGCAVILSFPVELTQLRQDVACVLERWNFLRAQKFGKKDSILDSDRHSRTSHGVAHVRSVAEHNETGRVNPCRRHPAVGHATQSPRPKSITKTALQVCGDNRQDSLGYVLSHGPLVPELVIGVVENIDENSCLTVADPIDKKRWPRPKDTVRILRDGELDAGEL